MVRLSGCGSPRGSRGVSVVDLAHVLGSFFLGLLVLLRISLVHLEASPTRCRRDLEEVSRSEHKIRIVAVVASS